MVSPQDRALDLGPQLVHPPPTVSPQGRALDLDPQPVHPPPTVSPQGRAMDLEPQPVHPPPTVSPQDRALDLEPQLVHPPPMVSLQGQALDLGRAWDLVDWNRHLRFHCRLDLVPDPLHCRDLSHHRDRQRHDPFPQPYLLLLQYWRHRLPRH